MFNTRFHQRLLTLPRIVLSCCIALSAALFGEYVQKPLPASAQTVSFRFVAWSDTHTDPNLSGNNTRVSEMSDHIVALNPNFTIVPGDLENTGFSTSAISIWKSAINGEYTGSTTPNGLFDKTFPSRGNHDTLLSGSTSAWQSYFDTEAKATAIGATNYSHLTGEDTLTYSFDYGNSHIVSLDSAGMFQDNATSTRINWLDGDLTAAEARGLVHAFLFFHGPVYCIEAGIWTMCPYADPGERISTMPALNNQMIAVINKHPIVSAIFNGHEGHNPYTRMDNTRIPSLTHPFEQFLVGYTAGSNVCDSSYAVRYDYCQPGRGFLLVEVSGETYTVKFYSAYTWTPVRTMTFINKVNRAGTTTTLDSSSSTTAYGQALTLVASATASSPGGPMPDGNVTFMDGANTLGTRMLNESGIATYTTSSLSASGSPHALTTVYAGSTNYLGSTSATLWQNVERANTSTTVSSSSNPSVVGQPTSFAATVLAIAPGAGTPSGTAQFKIDGADWGSPVGIVNGSATSPSTTLALGSHSVTVSYSGDGNFHSSAGSLSGGQTVNKANTTTTTTSHAPDPSVIGQPVDVHYSVVRASPTGMTPTGNVRVTDGTNSCTAAVSAGECSLTLTSVGSRSLIATFLGDDNFNGSTSAPVPHLVKYGTTTGITLDSPDPSVVGQSVTVHYSVTPLSGSNTPTGNVTVTDGTTLCTAVVAAGQCTLLLSTPGVRSLTATYAGDGNFVGSTSSAVAHTVNRANTTTTITGDSPHPSATGQAVTIEFTVLPIAPGAGTPSGNVTVSDGVISCTATVEAGSCSLVFGTAGNKTLIATYAGDSRFNGSTSSPASHTVTQLTTTTVTSSVSPSASGQMVIFTASVASTGSGVPSGTVQFVVDGVNFGQPVPLSSASASISTAALSVGTHTLTAIYSGDDIFAGSTSDVMLHKVNAATLKYFIPLIVR